MPVLAAREALSPARTSSHALEAALRAALQGPHTGAQAPTAELVHMAHEHLEAGGKRLRARLALVCAEGFDVPLPAARAWAVACELLHNGTLVHDDLQDGDTVRRGRPTTWVRFGAAQAINLGDWLLMRALAALADAALGAELGFRLTCRLREGLETVIAGQTLECHWRGQPIVSWAQYQACVRAKTAALFALPVHGAWLLGGQPAAAIEQAVQPFALVGELFQLADDIIDLYGDKGRATPGQDLYEGKMSALVVAHAAAAPVDRAWLEPLLHAPRDQTPAADVERARSAFVRSGALADVQQRVAALGCEAQALCPAPLRGPLEQLLTATLAPLARLNLPAEAAGVSPVA